MYKICCELVGIRNQSPWTKLLPLTLIRFRNNYSYQGLTSFEVIYGSPYLTSDLMLDEEIARLIYFAPQMARLQQKLSKLLAELLQEEQKGATLFCSGS